MSTGSMAHVGALLEAVDIYKLNSGKLRSLYERLLANQTGLEIKHAALVKEQEVFSHMLSYPKIDRPTRGPIVSSVQSIGRKSPTSRHLLNPAMQRCGG